MLLLAYDVEDPLSRRLVDRLLARDRIGLLVAFPRQNPELVKMAPELAGGPENLSLQGLDVDSRTVLQGNRLFAALLALNPRWAWLAPLLRWTGMPAFLYLGDWKALLPRRAWPGPKR